MRRRGANPPAGLRVKYCENVATYHKGLDRLGHPKLREYITHGWFIMVRVDAQWKPLMQLRFAREKDAMRAANSLMSAGIDCYKKLTEAEPLAVLEIATRYLQW